MTRVDDLGKHLGRWHERDREDMSETIVNAVCTKCGWSGPSDGRRGTKHSDCDYLAVQFGESPMGERSTQERNILFARGFVDGAGFQSIKHENVADYMTGYEAGRIMYNAAAKEFRDKNGLPEPMILRGQEGS